MSKALSEISKRLADVSPKEPVSDAQDVRPGLRLTRGVLRGWACGRWRLASVGFCCGRVLRP